MPSNLEAIGPILVSRSDLLERLVDFEIEPGAEFLQVVEVVGELEIRILDAAGIRGTHLGPPA